MALLMSQPPTPSRAHSGLSLFSRIKSHKESRHSRTSSRSETPRAETFHVNDKFDIRQSLCSIPAREGAGLKSRQLNAACQDEFVVDTCDLEDEFASASKFGLTKQCGKGASALVKVMIRRGDKKGEGSRYAVKEFRKKSSRESEDEYVSKVKSEYTIAKSVHHPNIVETVRLCTSGGRWNHVMEFCAQGELFSLVDKRYMKAEDRTCIFKQVLRGVEYLHSNGIAHRDIKLENLLMTENGYIKITDFGVSEVFRGDHPGWASSHGLCGQRLGEVRMSGAGICGSKPYISPEVLAQDKPYDASKLDVWSCGILYMTLLLAGNPWQSASKKEINYAEFLEGWDAFLARFGESPINENSYPQCGLVFNSLPTPGQRRCILKMLHPNPDKRCTIQDALSDRWVKSIKCCSPEAPGAFTPGCIDVAKQGSNALASRMCVQAKHDHLPPPVKRMPQHRFDMGDGTSRYD